MSAHEMRILTPSGVVLTLIESDSERSAVASYWNAVSHYLATGEDRPLRPFAGVSIAGHVLLTDLDAVEQWAAEGELEFEDIYNASDR